MIASSKNVSPLPAISLAGPEALESRVSAESIFASYEHTALHTMELVLDFADHDLSLRPGEGSMSAREVILHLAQSHFFVAALLAKDNPGKQDYQQALVVETVEDCMNSLAGGWKQVRVAFQNTGRTGASQVLEPFEGWKGSRVELFAQMSEHQAHHYGQLCVYARIAGKTPPLSYAPVSDKVYARLA
jgi:uncharacterized damage-inducible protein DinB